MLLYDSEKMGLFDLVYAATMHRLIAATGCIAIVQLVLWVVIIVVTHARTQELSLPTLSLSLFLSLSLAYSNSLDFIVWYRCIGLSCTGATHPPSSVTSHGGGCRPCRIISKGQVQRLDRTAPRVTRYAVSVCTLLAPNSLHKFFYR